MDRCVGVIALIMMLLGPAVPRNARAQEAAPRLDHRHQTGLALLPGVGFRIIVPYESNKQCDADDPRKQVCTTGSPPFVDLQLSFGASRRIDLLVDVRFTLAEDRVARDHPLVIAPGLRIWLDPDEQLKFFTTFQAVYDHTDYKGQVKSSDFGIRNANGLMYDVIRNVGFYFQFGETLGFIRWFRLELDAGLGVQVRFP